MVAIILTVLLVLDSSATRAETYRLRVGGLPPIRVLDAPGYRATLPGGTRSGAAEASDLSGEVADDPAPGVAMPVPAAVAASSGDSTPAPGKSWVGPEQLLGRPATPTGEFRARLARIYGLTAEADVEAVWNWFLAEPASLEFRDRVGNALVRHLLATGKATADASFGRLAAGQGTATVASANGVCVREVPWGPTIVTLPAGEVVEVISLPGGPWRRVRTPSGTGWICSLWLEPR